MCDTCNAHCVQPALRRRQKIEGIAGLGTQKHLLGRQRRRWGAGLNPGHHHRHHADDTDRDGSLHHGADGPPTLLWNSGVKLWSAMFNLVLTALRALLSCRPSKDPRRAGKPASRCWSMYKLQNRMKQ